jgi:guanylate kinase
MTLSTSKQKIVVLTAPSGSGKTTLIRHLMQAFPQLSFSVSACTRPPRAGEEHGKDYYFFSPEEFEALIAADAFIEWEMVYAGKYYGTLRSELSRIWQADMVPMIDVDVQGAMSVQRQYREQVRTIFIQAPSLEILRERLHKRGTETPESLEERINKANEELGYAANFDYILVNDDLETAIGELTRIVGNFLND